MRRVCALIFLMLFPALTASGQDLTASFPPGFGPLPTIELPPDLFPAVNGPTVHVYTKNRTWVQIRDFARPQISEGFEYQATLYQSMRNAGEIYLSIGGAHRDYIDRLRIFISVRYGADSFNAARIEAEGKLKEILGLSEPQLCALNITEQTLEMIVPEEFPNGLGLSFCPGAVTDEQIRAAIQRKP
jgi:hypothetical protein